MASYIARRILLMIPTLFGILLLSFLIVQFAPGGPVERVLAQMQGQDSGGDLAVRRRRSDDRRRREARRRRPNFPANIAAPRGSTPNSSPNSKSSSASTSRRSNGSG